MGFTFARVKDHWRGATNKKEGAADIGPKIHGPLSTQSLSIQDASKSPRRARGNSATGDFAIFDRASIFTATVLLFLIRVPGQRPSRVSIAEPKKNRRAETPKGLPARRHTHDRAPRPRSQFDQPGCPLFSHPTSATHYSAERPLSLLPVTAPYKLINPNQKSNALVEWAN
jgi:hypothetical protein